MAIVSVVGRYQQRQPVEAALRQLDYEELTASAYTTLVSQDDYGRLWRSVLRRGGEPVCFVEVVDMTPQPDGSYRRYFVHVPPGI